MSRAFTMVSPELWRSPRFLSLDSDGRVLVVYLLTNDHGNSAGCYRLPGAYACADLQWTPERYDTAMVAAISAGLVAYENVTSEILLDRWFSHCPPTNQKHATGVRRCIERIASDELRERAETDFLATEYGKQSTNVTSISDRLANTRLVREA